VIRAPLEDPGIWSITGFHHELVKYAVRLLIVSYWCDPKDVTTEYYVKVRKGRFWREKYFVDVAALPNDKRYIAVECGATSWRKLLDLKSVFDKVIHIPGGIYTQQGDRYREDVRRRHAELLIARWRR
jgi:hypothetical protein